MLRVIYLIMACFGSWGDVADSQTDFVTAHEVLTTAAQPPVDTETGDPPNSGSAFGSGESALQLRTDLSTGSTTTEFFTPPSTEGLLDYSSRCVSRLQESL